MGEDDHLDGESLKDDLLIRNVNLTVLLEYIEVATCTRHGRVLFACAWVYKGTGIPVQNLWGVTGYRHYSSPSALTL